MFPARRWRRACGRIIKERRATFAALPAQEAKRPCAVTAWDNLLLAGDWTATGLPATIEGAIRSGNRAADLALQAAQRGIS
jgi:hydroxysqualene dehydroxylase